MFAHSCRWFFAPPAPSQRLPSAVYLHEPCRRLYEAMPELPWLAEPGEYARTSISLQKVMGSALRIHPQRIQARRELENVRGFDLVLVNSFFNRENVMRTYGITSRVCYLGIDASRFEISDRPKQRTVLSVGYFDEHKRPEFVIRAIGASRTRPALRWVANQATPEYAERMRRLAQDLGVAFQLDIGVSEGDLVRAYQDAQLLAYAPRLEPFGLAPLEANSCGTPAVVVAEGGTRETVIDGENGRIVADEREMAHAIDDLIGAPERARALGARAAELVRTRWTLEAATSRLEGYLYEAVDAHRENAAARTSS